MLKLGRLAEIEVFQMETNIASQIYPILILIFLIGLLFIFEAFRINNNNGVVVENTLFYVLTFLISLTQFVMMDTNGMDATLWYVMVGGIIVIGLFIKFYIGGKSIKIYNIDKQEVLTTVEEELNNVSISYEKMDGESSEDHLYDLSEGVVMKISENLVGGDITISFKKGWRLQEVQELQYRLLDIFRKKREGKIFWKPIVVNTSLGLGFIMGTIFLFNIM